MPTVSGSTPMTTARYGVLTPRQWAWISHLTNPVAPGRTVTPVGRLPAITTGAGCRSTTGAGRGFKTTGAGSRGIAGDRPGSTGGTAAASSAGGLGRRALATIALAVRA